jgi:hypothetical protein
MTLFGSPAYLRAAAAHDGGTPAVIALHGVSVPMIAQPDGGLHTPYGYPLPEGESDAAALGAAAAAAVGCPHAWRAALAPLGRGAALAGALRERLAPVSSRPVCVHDLDSGEPLERFEAGARSMVRRALRAGGRLEVGPVTTTFGALYRGAMDAVGSPSHYRFGDDYLLALNAAGARQFALHDQHGLAAAALFMIAPPEATYHLSARRRDPAPAPGAANLLVAEGLRHCRDAGAEYCYLGGGTSTGGDDPLLAFKQTMATRTVDRPVFEHAGAA